MLYYIAPQTNIFYDNFNVSRNRKKNVILVYIVSNTKYCLLQQFLYFIYNFYVTVTLKLQHKSYVDFTTEYLLKLLNMYWYQPK